jgi:hypothetical protein
VLSSAELGESIVQKFQPGLPGAWQPLFECQCWLDTGNVACGQTVFCIMAGAVMTGFLDTIYRRQAEKSEEMERIHRPISTGYRVCRNFSEPVLLI